MQLIGLSGKMGAGKTSVAIYLEPYGYCKYSFANKLKNMVAELDGSDPAGPDWKSETIDGWDITRGTLLQKLGSLVRNLNPDAWVLALFAMVNRDKAQYVVIDDVRYPNEAEAIRSRGGIVIRIERPSNNGANQNGRDMNHHSETALDDYEFDYIISSDDLNEVYSQLDDIISPIWN